MTNVSDIFDDLGGPAGVARILDCNPSTASEMKRRRSIPVRHWPRLIVASKGKLTPEILMLVNSHERESARNNAA